MSKYIEVDGVEGLVEVPDGITEEQILDVGEQLTQGRVQSAAGAMMREGGSMWGKAAQSLARVGQVLGNSGLTVGPGGAMFTSPDAAMAGSRMTGQEKQTQLEEDPTYQFGENLAAGAEEAFPVNPLHADKLDHAVASGVGSIFGLMPSVVAGPLAPLAGGSMYGLSAGETAAEDAQAILDARIQAALAQGDMATAATLEQDKFGIQTAAFLATVPIGAGTEAALGIAGRLGAMAKGKGGMLGSMTEKVVGALTKNQAVTRGAEGLVSESLQEGLEQIGGNLVAKGLYDPERDVTEGLGMSMLAGGIVGGGFGAGAGALADHGNRSSPVDPTEPERALAPESSSQVQDMLDALAKANEVTKDNFKDEEAITPEMEVPVDVTPPPVEAPVDVTPPPPVEEQADLQAELDAQVSAGTTEEPPTPESPEQVEAQLEATLDPASTKAVTLVTPGEELPPIPEGLEVGEPTEAGTPVFNPKKITVQRLTEAGKWETYDPEVLGLGAEVAQSDTAVTTSTPDGTPVLDELVTPETVDAAIEAQQDAVPGGITEIKPAAEIVEKRKEPTEEDVLNLFNEFPKIGVSAVQRRLKLGYQRSLQLLNELKKKGLITSDDAGGWVKAESKDQSAPTTVDEAAKWLSDRAPGMFTERGAKTSAQKVFDAIQTGTFGDILGPDNKNSRALFTKLTGIKLPDTLKGTKAVFTGKPFPLSSAKPEAPTQGPTTPTPPGSAPSPDAGKQGVGVQSPQAKVSLTPEKLAAIKAERAKIAAEMRALMGGVGAGVDPKYLTLAARMVGTYVEEGYLRFSDFARQFKKDFPDMWDNAKSYLRGAWNAVSDQDDRIKEMSKAEAAGDIAAAEDPEPQLDPKQKQEEQEAEIVAQAKAIAQGTGTDAEKYAKLVAMYKAQARLGIRTTDSKLAQAYSTPPPLAFIAGLLADLRNGTKIAESTVGNGMLLITAPDSAGIAANELDPKRAARFERVFRVKPTQMDAAGQEYFDAMSDLKPDRVILNPPFGARLAETGNETFQLRGATIGNATTKSLDLAIALNTLETMEEDGKAVIILGAKTGSMAANINQKTRVEGYRRREYLDLFNRFNVVDMFTINGDMYEKMGAGWPVDVVVISGKRKTPSSKEGGFVRPWIEAPRVYNDWESLGELINENEQRRSSPGTGGGNSGGVDLDPQRGTPGPSNAPSEPGQRGGGVPEGRPRQSDKAGKKDRAVEPDSKHAPGSDPKLDESKAGGSKEDAALDGGSSSDSGSGSLTEPYKSNSGAKPSGLVVPANIASDQRAALNDLEREEGKSVDEYLSEKLGMTINELYESFSGPQIDATSLAIRNIERGSALINSDQTGTGKGRTVAALIRYAMKRGLTPIFVTAKHTLYTDMAGRDLPAIGVNNFTPLVTNKRVKWTGADGKVVSQDLSAQESSDILGEVARTGKLPSGTHAFFTTIDQLNGDDPPGFREDAKAKAKRKRNRDPRPLGPILKAVKSLAPNAILIMDESHLAAGDSSNINHQLVEDTGGGSIIDSAKGVYYSSATFAKRPDNIALYAAGTSIKRAGLGLKELVQMLKSGKLPLQQALTSMLSRMGEFVRRQQDWGNVKIEFKKATNNAEREVRMADTYTEFLLSLERFSKLIRKAADVLEDDENQIRAEEAAVDVESTSFASRLFNLSSQYLTALRAEAVASEAVEALKNGEKPVISFFNTMEGPISDLQEMGLPINFNGMLRRELENLLTVTVKDPTKPPGEQNTKVKLTRGQLTEKGRAEYDRIVHDIDNTDLGDMPISPMDTVQRRIKDAGFTVGEVTARSMSLEIDEQGNPVAKSRKKGNRNDIISDFNHDRVNALVMNGSASTGVSMHTAPNFSPKGRVLIVAQPNPDINEFIQVLGRVMRFGQVKLPRYVVLSSSLAAEQRFMVMLRRKMASLNANTSADTDSEMTGNAGFAEDIFNEVGDDVVGRVVMSPGNLEWALAVGIPLMDPDEDSVGDGSYASRATGKFVLLPNEVAKRMWDQVTEMYRDTISALDESGENPLKAQVEDLKAKTVEVTPFVAGDGKTPFDGPAMLEKVTVKPTKSAPSYSDATESARKNEQSVRAKIRDWISKSREMEEERIKVAESRESTPAQLDNIRKAFENTRNYVASTADLIGTAYEITDNGYVAIPTDLQLRDKEMSDFTSPSAHYLMVTRNMVNSKARYALSQVADRLKTNDPIDRAEDKWNESLESSTERYIVTGNLLRGYSQAMQASRGMSKPRIAIYTTSDGDKKTGVLMASNWTPDAVQEVVRTPINDLTHFIQALGLGTAIVADGLSIKNDVIRVNASNRFKPIWSGWPFAGAQQRGSEFVVRFAPSSATQIYEFLTSKGVQLRTDRVEDALNRAIKATDPSGHSFEFMAGISYAVANTALKVAKAVYLVTRDIVKAVNAAIEKLREEVPDGFNEDEARVLLTDAIEAGTESFFTPAAGEKVQESKGRFTGLVSKDSDKQWQKQAEEWLSGFGNNLQDAYEKSISAVTPIDASLRQYVLSELLSRTDWAIDALKNSPSSVFKMMPLLKLQSEIANSLKDSGKHEFGSVGAARALAFKRIEWMMPMLLLRKLVKDAQAKLPFPDITSDKVREWLKRAGSRAVSEVKKAMKDADAVVARELRREVKSLGVNWGDIIRSSEAVQGDFRRALYRQVMDHPKLAGLSPKSVTEIVNLLANEWEKQRLRIFRQEFEKEVKLPRVSKRTMDRLQEAIPAIVIQANVGLLDNEAFRNAVAPKFGVEQFDSKTADLVKKLAQEAQGMKGVNRTKLLNRITDTIQRSGGVAKSDVFRDYWFAAMLSGIKTMVDNGLGILSGGLTTSLAMMRNPSAVPLMTRAYLSGLSEAGSDFVPILKGERWRTHNVDIDRPASALDAMLASPNPFKKALGTMAYVSRMISALDHLNALSTRQAMIAWAAMRSDPATAEAMLTVTPEQRAEAREQAIQEGTEKGLLNKRIREILEERVPVEMVITATQIGLIASFQNEPYGVAGHFYQFIKRLDKMPGFGKFTRLISGTAFARYALNYTNDILNYVSPIGMIRWYASAPGNQDKAHGLKISEEERQLIMMKSILGSLVAAAAAAVFLGDDDDDEKERAIDITGSFKSLDPDKRNQLLSEQRQPYSIRFGDTYVSYRQLPIAGILGTVGEMRDKQLFAPDKWKEQSPTSTVANAAIAGMFIVRDSSALTGLMDLLGFASAYKYDTDAMIEKSIPRFVARLLGGMIPNIAKEIDAWQDPSIYKATHGWEYFLQQVPWGRRSLDPGPQVNVLGEKIAVERLPWSRWVKERSKDPAWDTMGKLADRGIFMPVPGEFLVENDDGTRGKPSKKQMYDYQKAVGEAYKEYIKSDGADLLAMTPAEARKAIDRKTTRLRKQARRELGL